MKSLSPNKLASSSASSASSGSIDNLTDVDTSTVTPTDGQALLWDNTASKWEPGSIAAGTSTAQITAITLLFS